MFFYAGRIIARWGARRVMIVAMAMTMLRWSLTALCADHLAVLVILQFGHAFSFAAYHAVAMRYVQSMFPGALQGRGQASYNAAAYGLGGSIGSVTSERGRASCRERVWPAGWIWGDPRI